MRGYRDILLSPVGAFITLAGVARLTWGIEALALIVHVEEAADSFAAAGLAVGALGVTSAALAPLRGRLIDRRGRAALVAMTVAVAAAIAAIALTPAAGPGALSYVLLAGLAGVVAPPFSAWTRSGLAHRLGGQRLQLAYTVDNVFEESAFVVGPMLAGGLIAIASAGAALVFAAALGLTAGLLLAYARWAVVWAPRQREPDPGRRGEINRPLLLAIASLGGVGWALGCIEVAVPAFAKAEGAVASAGVAFAALSAGGVIGALIYGARTWQAPASRRYVALLAGLALGTAALALPSSIAALVAVAAVAGLALTPAFVTNSILIEQLSLGSPTAAAFSGTSTAVNGAVAVAAPVAGVLVEGSGTDAAFLAGAAGLSLAALAALALPSTSPSPAAGPESIAEAVTVSQSRGT
jgi:MFS family permease